jgi:hypothetical protein
VQVNGKKLNRVAELILSPHHPSITHARDFLATEIWGLVIMKTYILWNGLFREGKILPSLQKKAS